MKKNILFIIPSLGSGGAERSLINLLSQINYNDYNVDLFLLNDEWIFMDFIPKEVNVIKITNNIKNFNLAVGKSVMNFIKQGNINLAYNRMIFCIKSRVIKNTGKAEQYTWTNLRKVIGRVDKKYDASISFLEKTANYICVDCVEAEKKIGWIHNDYRKLNVDKEFDKRYFEKMDYLMTVSEECESVLKEEFPMYRDKIKLMFNIVSKKMIEHLAEEPLDEGELSNDKINILSIGRLHGQKGFDMAVEACKELIKRGYKVNWNIIGVGNEKEMLEKLVAEKGIKDSFNFLGLKSNPYKYLKASDIYAQPSRYEGKSVAIDEAKILCKPIVVTNFSTVYDQIENNETGIICDMNPNHIADGIEKLIKDKKLLNRIINNLKDVECSNEKEVNKLYKLIQ